MNLGDRIKGYEKTFAHTAVKRSPLMIRVDGRAFHTFTRSCLKPFDGNLMTHMVMAAVHVADDMQGFKAAYVQSDEVTFLLTDYDNLETQGWFDYKLSKVVSISAALMTAHFNHQYKPEKPQVFDGRAFTLPKGEVINAFLWRAKDWERNSLQMYARAFFSHKELHKKNKEEIHEMLHQIGKNWTTDLSDIEKNGTFLIREPEQEIKIRADILPNYESINAAIGGLF